MKMTWILSGSLKYQLIFGSERLSEDTARASGRAIESEPQLPEELRL